MTTNQHFELSQSKYGMASELTTNVRPKKFMVWADEQGRIAMGIWAGGGGFFNDLGLTVFFFSFFSIRV